MKRATKSPAPPRRKASAKRADRVADGGLVFRALADPSRRRILDILREGGRTSGDLAREFPSVSRYAVMKHLGILVAADLVLVRREGRERWNHLNAVPLRNLYERWVSLFASRRAAGLTALKHAVESKLGAAAMTAGATVFQSHKIEMEIVIDAPRDRVWSAFTAEIDSWWAYRILSSDVKLILEPHAGGRLYELEPNGDTGLWGMVLEVRAGRLLKLQDNFGSFQPGAYGTSTWKLEERGAKTAIQFTSVFSGVADEKLLASMDSGWRELMDKYLRAWVEKGEAAPKMSDGC